MIDRLAAAIVDEGRWLTASVGLALIVVALVVRRSRAVHVPERRLVLAAMSLFFGVTVGTMAFGHLIAVTTKLITGSLDGSLVVFYAIGAALAAPSWWLIHHTRHILHDDGRHRRTTLSLNAWLAATLLALGVHNLPLAAPAFFNIAYALHTRPAVGWTLAGLATIVNLGLFIGSLVFLASGQSFEQFSGVE